MLIASGCLLLLTCALVQVLLSCSMRRAALGSVLAASVAQAAWNRHAVVSPAASASALAAFCVACAAIFIAHQRYAARVSGLVVLCDVDEATGCLNRRGFAARLEAAAGDAMRTGAPVALLALDLDHFKQVNDRFGHLAGDAVLGEVSATVMEAVGTRGVVARLGGEEFAVLLPDTDAEAAGVIAEQVLAMLRARRLRALPESVRLTMSIGIASERIHHHGSSDSLRARADEALYAGKRSGRDRALLWAPGVHSNATPARGVPNILREIPTRALGTAAPRWFDSGIRAD